MKVVARTGEYTIYKKRNQRYAVRNKDKQWVRGEDKVAILLANNLMEAPVPKAPEHPEPPATEAAASEAGSGEPGAAESGESAQEQS
jgi:hypothetical protein